MAIPMARMFSRELKTTIIHIYAYEKKTLCGAITNPFMKEPLYFENVMQFLLLTENLLDSIGFPQKSMELREHVQKRQNAATTLPVVERDHSKKRPIATFELEVLFRQNASWQGCLTWAEKNTSCSFRSTLELLFLLDDFLEMADA